ncbi:MAG: hypothetical protein ACRC0V_04525, partial [Fusobacteriaceae bacterium]
MYSRETQKLMHWLMTDIANFIHGDSSSFFLGITKKQLKHDYFRQDLSINKNLAEKRLFDLSFEFMNDTNLQGLDYFNDNFPEFLVKFERELFNFSVAQDEMTQAQANGFVRYLFDLMYHYNVPFRDEIIELLKAGDDNSYVWT